MAGLPTFLVELDDGSGDFPYDVTQHVSLKAGWSITRGRSDEHASVTAAVLGLTLENEDGRFTLGGYLGNLVTNPSFETNTTGWTANAGAALARVTTQHAVGVAAMSITSAGATAGAFCTSFAVTAGARYSAQFKTKAATVARSVQCNVQWYTAALALISTSTGTATNSTSGWTLHTVSATAPATAAFALVQFFLPTTAAAEVHWLDAVMCERRDEPGAYLDAGSVRNDQMIRFTETVGATTSKRFTGYVQEWPVEWPGGGQEYAVARITAVDRLPRLARRKLKSMLAHEYLADSPLLFYQLTEPGGALTAGDTSGNGGPLLVPNGVGIAAAEFGGTFLDGMGSVMFDETMQRLRTAEPVFLGSPAVLWMECFFTVSTADQAYVVTVAFEGLSIFSTISVTAGSVGVSLTGGVTLPIMSGPAAPGWLVHVAVKAIHGVGAELYIDGILVDSEANASFSTAPWGIARFIELGSPTVTGELTMSHFALGTSNIAAARFRDHALAPTYPGITESSDDRVTRLASYANIDPGDLDLEGGVLASMPSRHGMSGMTVDTALQEAAAAEGGLVFIDGEGQVVFQNRDHRRGQATAAATFTADALAPDLRPAADMMQVRNDVTGTRPGGAEQRVVNQASIDDHEQYPDSIELQVLTDQEVKDRIDWIAGVYAEPHSRIPGVTVDLLSQTSTVQEVVLGLEISDRIDLSGLPSQAPADVTRQLIEGWTESGNEREWSISFNTSPFEVERAWVLGDAVLGVLDSTTRLGY